MKTCDEGQDELRPLLTDEFLSTLVLAARTVGWDVDHTETFAFVQCCYEIVGRTRDDMPDMEPFEYAE